MEALLGQSEGEVYGDGGFADAAFGTADGYYFVYVGDGAFFGEALGEDVSFDAGSWRGGGFDRDCFFFI